MKGFSVLFIRLALLLFARDAVSQESIPLDYSSGYIEDAPFGLMGSLVIWAFMLGLVVLFCLLIGLGLALGLAIIVGLAAMFGAGGVVTSLVGFATTRKPQVGWRIFSMWMHAGFMLMAGAGIGGFIVPMIWPDAAPWSAAGMGALAGLGTGIAWGWILAIAVERSMSFLKETIHPLLSPKS
jgi:hypothetical protein